MDKALKRISRLLVKSTFGEREKDVPFCVERELSSSDVVVGVKDVGILSCPVSEQDVKTIINISSKARFGLRDQTLLDVNIRDSYEVKADKLQVTLNDNFLKLLSEMGKVLGLPENAELKPYLHNMLIYGPGQFFSKHQDTEKLSGMVATLVIVLPSPHIGGDLIIEHKGANHVFTSENINSTMSKCIAFYSDCEHEVIKIKQGYRIALTYNLVLPSGHVPGGDINLGLKIAVDAYFKLSDKKKSDSTGSYLFYRRDLESSRSYLVYFLNYSYTEHSLRWDMLKGMDRKNAFDLFNIAKELALIPNLALVEIHECYSADSGYEPRRRYKYAKYDMSDDSCDDDDHVHVLDDLLENDTTLSHWIGPNNEVLSLTDIHVSGDNICWIKDTKEFKPDRKEYEGYTGNAGCTMEYWYRRAAVVLVKASPDNESLINFSHNYTAAIKEFFELVKQPSKEKQVLEIMEKLEGHLYRNDFRDDKNDFKMFADLVLSIESRDIAQKLLSNFDWNIFNSDVTEILVKLQNKYDAVFLNAMLTSWKNRNAKQHDGHISVLKNFYVMVDCLLASTIDITIIEWMIEIQKNAIIQVFQKPSYSRNYDVAIKEFFDLVKRPSEKKQVLEIIENVGGLLYQNNSGGSEDDFKTFAKLALSIESRSIANKLLSYFNWNILSSDIMEMLVKLQNKYGTDFLSELLTSWKDSAKQYNGLVIVNVVRNFYAVVDCLVTCGIDITFIQLMTNMQMDAIVHEFQKSSYSRDYDIVIKEFFDIVKQSSEEKQVSKIIEKVGRHLFRIPSGDNEKDFKTFVEFVLSIESRNIAQKLLSYFDWNLLNSDVTEILVILQNKYDAAFLCALLTSWKNQNARQHNGHVNALKNFYGVVDSLLASGVDVTIIQLMIEVEKNAIIGEFQNSAYSYCRFTPVSGKLNRLKQILQACLLVPSESSQIQIVICIVENPKCYSMHDLVSLFFELRKNPVSYQAPYYKPLKDYLVAKITEHVAHNRSNDDWSIDVELSCSCEYCRVAKRFLESKTQTKKVWPIAMKHREHVTKSLLSLKLPITLTVERIGSPHKLIITKNATLHDIMKTEFNKFTSYLADLQAELYVKSEID